MKSTILLEGMVLIVCLLMLSALPVSSQIDYCEGNFDYDQDVDGGDAFIFKENFGRSMFKNPCPPDGPALLPKTGQTGRVSFGDDGNWQTGVEWPNPRFVDNENGTITDNLTGLIWLRENNCFGQRTWGQAISDANGLADGVCGLTDSSIAGHWRLPNIKELLSLIDYGHFSPALPSGHPFGYVQIAFYWSSTTSAYNAYPWCVNLYGGYSEPCGGGEISSWYVWPVRGGRFQVRFTENGDGTVTDNNTGLIWLKNADCFGWMNWYDASNAVSNLSPGQCNLADSSAPGDWRIPIQDEWEDFVCTQFTDPAVCNVTGTGKWVEGNPFTNVQTSMYWSDTSLDPDNAWAVLIGDGSETFGHKSGSDGHVWPVREP